MSAILNHQISTGLKTSLTGLTALPDWFSDEVFVLSLYKRDITRLVGRYVHSTTTHTSLLKTHVIFNNKTLKTTKQYSIESNIILPLNFPHINLLPIYLHDMHLIKPHQTPHIPTRPVSHYHCSLIPCLLLHVEPSGLFICHILLTKYGFHWQPVYLQHIVYPVLQ